MLSDLCKYHGVGDTPRSNERRPADPVSLRPVVRTPAITGVKVGDFAAPGGGSGHVIVTQWRFDNFADNDGFKQAIDEDVRAIRELYKTVLPYSATLFRKYVEAVISIYGAMLMVRQKLASYNQVHGTIPYLHDALTAVPSNPTELGVVAASKIQFLEDDEISVTLSTYTFMVNRVKELVIPPAVKKYLDWLFANQFTDSNLIAPQFYINELVDIPLYGNVNNDIVVIKTFDLRTGHLSDILDSINDIISLGAMMNADLHRTALMVDMIVPELANKIVDKDYEYFNILINATSSDDGVEFGTADVYANPFSPEYSRVDLIGSTDDSHIQAAALGALRRWGHGLLVEIISQAIYMPSGIGGCAPINRITTVSSAFQTGMMKQEDPFYIQFSGKYINSMRSYRYAANASQTYVVNADNRLPEGITFSSAALTASGDRRSWTNPTVIVLAESNSGARLEIRVNLVAETAKLYLVKTDTNTDYDLGTLGTAGVPFTATFVSTFQPGLKSVTITPVNETNNISGATQIATVAKLFGNDGVFNWFNLSASFTYTKNTVSYSVDYSDPVLLALFVEQIDYHIPMNYAMECFTIDEGTVVLGSIVAFTQLKESYTPLILNKPDCEAFLRYATLGMFTSGGSSKYAIPRKNYTASKSDGKFRGKKRSKEKLPDEEGSK